MDWKTIGNYVLLVGLFVAMVTMFNQVNGRIDSLQAETTRRFDIMQAESNRRFDEMQAENNRMQAEMNRRFDRVDQRFDQIFEVLRVFEGRIHALRKKPVSAPRTPSKHAAPLCCGFPLAILGRFFQGAGSFRWGGGPNSGKAADVAGPRVTPVRVFRRASQLAAAENLPPGDRKGADDTSVFPPIPSDFGAFPISGGALELVAGPFWFGPATTRVSAFPKIYILGSYQVRRARRHSSAGASPARQLSLQPAAVGADDEGDDIV